MTSKESANGESCILKLKYNNPVPSVKINNIQFYKTNHKNIHISKCGQIYNDKRKNVTFGNYDKDGYLRISVNEPYKGSKGVHSILMETFYGKCPTGYVVDHINSIRNDNRIENLRYVTNAFNVRRGRLGIKPKIAQKTVVKFENNTYNFNSILEFLTFFDMDSRVLYRFKHNKPKGKRQQYIIHSFITMDECNYIELTKFSYKLSLDDKNYEFNSIKSLLEFLNISHIAYYSRYISKKRNCCGYKIIDFNEGLETIEIIMETIKVE